MSRYFRVICWIKTTSDLRISLGWVYARLSIFTLIIDLFTSIFNFYRRWIICWFNRCLFSLSFYLFQLISRLIPHFIHLQSFWFYINKWLIHRNRQFFLLNDSFLWQNKLLVSIKHNRYSSLLLDNHSIFWFRW